jgi:hypothetical protein
MIGSTRTGDQEEKWIPLMLFISLVKEGDRPLGRSQMFQYMGGTKMLAGYNYKIQWWFNDVSNACKVIRAIGARSLSEVNLRDKQTGRILANYTGMISHPYGVAEEKTVNWIRYNVGKFPNAAVEILRR